MGFLSTKVMAYIMAAMLVFMGWQWVQIAGYKVAAASQETEMAQKNAELGVAKANNSVLNQAINKQNMSIELAAQEAARKRAAALAARDQAVADLASMQENYASLKNSWPKDCVVAVGMARRELGLL